MFYKDIWRIQISWESDKEFDRNCENTHETTAIFKWGGGG